jgi:hypothetical protein
VNSALNNSGAAFEPGAGRNWYVGFSASRNY